MGTPIKTLILGGSGMLGHKLYQVLAARPGAFEAYATFRRGAASFAGLGLFDPGRVIGNVSAADFDSVVKAIATVRPGVVVNCVGIVKQDAAAKDPVPSITVNALFPHRLAQLCRPAGVRLIHLSTDCVFSGRRGGYAEADAPDAEDLYGRSKLLGEVSADGCLTLRTSMIGRQLEGSYSLVEWFLGQAARRGMTIKGFKKAIFSGFTTNALAELIAEVVTEHAQLQGVWQVAADPISKFDLLSLVKRVYGLDIAIEADETFACDRSLRADRFRQATGYVPAPWPAMIEQMQQDPTPYERLRSQHGNE